MNKDIEETSKWQSQVFFALNKIANDNQVSAHDMCLVLVGMITNCFEQENVDPTIVKEFLEKVIEMYDQMFKERRKNGMD